MRRLYDVSIIYDDALQSMAKSLHSLCFVILLLFSHEENPYRSIIDDILYLLFTACGIERDSDSSHSVSAEIGEDILHGILREHAYVLLNLHSEIEQSI